MGAGVFGALFITGVVIYFIGWLLGLGEKVDNNRWERNLERRRAGLEDYPLPKYRLTSRGCLWLMVLIPAALLGLGQFLSEVWQ